MNDEAGHQATHGEALKPDSVEPADVGAEVEQEGGGESLTHPSKLIRIATMTRAMLDEVRQAPIDDKGRARLAEVHRQSVDELRDVLSDDLLEEFDQLMVPLKNEESSEGEIRIAQAQLIGWLEGLFHGIQASLFSQQLAAQNQLAEMQRRSLQRPQSDQDQGPGLYL